MASYRVLSNDAVLVESDHLIGFVLANLLHA